ncbi:hypothetical protein GmRootV15_31000 [Variovorax sp. V15]
MHPPKAGAAERKHGQGGEQEEREEETAHESDVGMTGKKPEAIKKRCPCEPKGWSPCRLEGTGPAMIIQR